MNDTQIPQSPQSVRRNKSAAQRRYRKKEEEAFLLLREALKEVVKDDPRTRQDILTTASCELRRLADEKDLLLEQKARIEAWSTSKEIYKDEHSQSPSGRVIYEDPMQWWSHDRTKMADITRSDMARYRVLDAAMPSGNVTMPTVQGPQWFVQMHDATVAHDSSRLDHPWAQYQSGDVARRPHCGYSAGCDCQFGE